MKALPRRSQLRTEGGGDKGELSRGPLTLSPAQRRALLAGEEFLLTPSEFDFLASLLQNRERAVSRAELLERALDNLLTNAIRYARTSVRVEARETGEGFALAVADDGDGISPRDLPHLFERCHKGKGGQFGLGLTIARAAAQAMGGTLTAGNTPEGGAVFTLTLRRAPQEKTLIS